MPNDQTGPLAVPLMNQQLPEQPREIEPCPWCFGTPACVLDDSFYSKVKCPCGACGPELPLPPEYPSPSVESDAVFAMNIERWNEVARLRSKLDLVELERSEAQEELDDMKDKWSRQVAFEAGDQHD